MEQMANVMQQTRRDELRRSVGLLGGMSGLERVLKL